MRGSVWTFCLLVAVLAIFNFAFIVLVTPRYMHLGRKEKSTTTERPDHSTNNFAIIPATRAVMVETRTVSKVVVSEKCPEKSDYLVGPLAVNVEWAKKNYWTESNLQPNETINDTSIYMGKHLTISSDNIPKLKLSDVTHQPKYCKSDYKTAIIIPFRDRESHLRILLGHLVPALRRQFIEYSIFVVEQHGKLTFNKGRLMNTGFDFAHMIGKKFGKSYDCYVFQDVDLLPERDDLLYKCSDGDVADHLSSSIDKFNYKPVCCGMTVGGVLAFKEEQYRKVNGFPNSFWGWGGEDDDMNLRIRKQGLKIKRPPVEMGRYTMIKHTRDDRNPKNPKAGENLKKSWERAENDGIADLDTSIVEVHLYPTFTKIIVNVGLPPT